MKMTPAAALALLVIFTGAAASQQAEPPGRVYFNGYLDVYSKGRTDLQQLPGRRDADLSANTMLLTCPFNLQTNQPTTDQANIIFNRFSLQQFRRYLPLRTGPEFIEPGIDAAGRRVIYDTQLPNAKYYNLYIDANGEFHHTNRPEIRERLLREAQAGTLDLAGISAKGMAEMYEKLAPAASRFCFAGS